MASAVPRQLVEKIAALPPEGIARVEAFVDAISDDPDSVSLRTDWMKLSEINFAAVWDNPDDAIYDDL